MDPALANPVRIIEGLGRRADGPTDDRAQIDFTDFGAPVQIEAPAPDQVTTFP